MQMRKARFSAIFSVWHAPCKPVRHGRRNGPAAGSGNSDMTFNLSNLQHIAISLVGAIFAASLSISAAVGPVAQFI
jgi:hypothetical protein